MIILYTLQGLIGGILFGVPFLIIARESNTSSRGGNNNSNGKKKISIDGKNTSNIVHGNNNNNRISAYTVITGYGFILLFVSGTATVSQTPYPQFGLSSISFVGLSSYLIFVGLYYSAVSISSDSTIRKSIREFVSGQDRSALLESIGTAHMQQEIERRVLKIAKEQQQALAENTEVAPSLVVKTGHGNRRN